VDHIVPKNQGGSYDLNNLQALCFRCNAGQRDGCLPTQEGTTDFRGLQASDDLRGRDQKGKVAATSERRISRVSGSMGEGSKPMCR
jgi:hypothetical protein